MIMKEWGWLRWVGAVVLVGVIGLGIWLILRPRQLKDETWTRIQKDGVFRVGLDASFPPFEAVASDGSLIGLDIALAQELGHRLGGLQPEFINLGFDSLYDALLAEKCDLILSALPYDPLRTQDVAYTIGYFDAGLVLVVAAEHSANAITGPEDLAGRRLAVEWGSHADAEGRRLAQRLSNLKLVPFPDPTAVLQAVVDGQADAALTDAVSAWQFRARTGQVTILPGRLVEEPYVIAVRADAPLLLAALNKALIEMKTDGSLEKLWTTWLR